MAAAAALKRGPSQGGTPPPAPAHGEVDVDRDAAQYTAVTRWIVLVAVMLGTLLELVDTSVVNVALPVMMGNLGATITEIGWVSTGYIIANVIVLPLTGWLSSYFGRRMYLTGSICLFTVASFLCGHAHSLPELVAFRVLQGAGGAGLLSSAQATLMEVFPRRQIAMVQAIFAMGVVFAPTIGPTIGGWITDNYNWPWIFYVNIPIGILAAFLVWNFLKDSAFQTKPKGRIDVIGIFLLAVGLGSLQTLLEKGNEEGWFHSNLIIGLSASAAIGMYLFVVWELYTDNPAVNLRVLKHRGFTAATLMATVLGFGMYGGIFILPLFLQEVRGFTPTQAGLAVLPGGIATILTLPFVGRGLKKIEPRYFIPVGSVIGFIAFWGLSMLTTQSSMEDVYLPYIIRGIGGAMLYLPLSLSALTGIHPKDLQGGAGLYNLSRQLGGSFGIAALATYISHRSVIDRSYLSSHITATNDIAHQHAQALTGLFIAKGHASQAAHQMAYAAIHGQVNLQASMLTYNTAFRIAALCWLVGVPMFFLLDRGTIANRKVPSH